MPTTAINDLPYPALATPAQPDIPADFQALAEQVDTRLVARYASAAARDAAIPAPVDGMVCYLADTDSFSSRVNGAWVSMVVANATWQNPAAGTAGLRSIGVTSVTAHAGDVGAAAETRAVAAPGGVCAGLTAATATATATATVVSAPAADHIRVVKSIVVATGASSTALDLTIGATAAATGIPITGRSVMELSTVFILNAGEALSVTVVGGAVDVTATFVDLLAASTDVARLGFASGAGSGTLVSTDATDRVVTQWWVQNTDSVTGAATLTVATKKVLDGVSIAPGGIVMVDDPIVLGAASTATYAATDATMAWHAAGWTE